MIPVISVIGWHNVGKTTFLVALIAELKARGWRVATVKHTGGHFDMDRPGTDTWRYAQAGSDLVVISGRGRLAILEHSRDDLSLTEILARLPGEVDVVLTEGFKREPTPKIEVHRAGTGGGPIASSDELLAIVGDTPCGYSDDVPCFALEDASGVADLLEARGLLIRRPCADAR
ncbi:MAG: molybdopterin-guanine dinucleotide biosynthesis protein B [Chloroflexi bacterium]|nr:molybdopterin-guanine dinucleotide biosynthesis protein B [Chloroflexota bacterium]